METSTDPESDCGSWDPEERLLSVAQFAAITGLAVSTVRHMLVRNQIPGFGRVGRSRRISVAAVRRFLAAGFPQEPSPENSTIEVACPVRSKYCREAKSGKIVLQGPYTAGPPGRIASSSESLN